jgi:hypothetical protein
MLVKILQLACNPHTPFTRIATRAQYAQLTMWTARVLSQSMVLEHMKEDDESRVREHGRVLSTTPTKPTSLHPSAPSSSRCAAAVSPLLSASRRLFAHVEVGCAARVRVPPVGAGEAGDRRARLCQSRGRPDAEGGSARRRSGAP